MLPKSDLPSLSYRWADNFVAEGCRGSKEHSFQHPFLQVPGRVPPTSYLLGLRPGAPTMRPGCFLTYEWRLLLPEEPSTSLSLPPQSRIQGLEEGKEHHPLRKSWQVVMSSPHPS